MAEIREGTRVLILASDSGILAETTARCAGSSAVTSQALDFSAILKFSERFDAVLCIENLAAAPNSEETVLAMARLLHPVGWLGICTWTESGRMPLHGIALDVLDALNATGAAGIPDDPALGGFRERARTESGAIEPGILFGMLEKAGLSAVERRALQVIHTFADADECASCWLDHIFPGANGENLSDPVRKAAHTLLVEKVQIHARPDRSIRMVSEATVVVGQNAVRQYF